jgi:GTPase SAR1 family protein
VGLGAALMSSNLLLLGLAIFPVLLLLPRSLPRAISLPEPLPFSPSAINASGQHQGQDLEQEQGQEFDEKVSPAAPDVFVCYREQEKRRIVASLKAAGSLLICGEEGCGKSVLIQAVVNQLQAEGYPIALVEPSTPFLMLADICLQLGIASESLDGKKFTAAQLKQAVALYLETHTAFLVFDDAHACEAKFRMWLKHLKRSGVSLLLAATNPPRTDVFVNVPRIELQPLPPYAIRQIMEQAALERGLSLTNTELAKLQERALGNPNLAVRVIEEEYLGLEVEASDLGPKHYTDITPLILLAGVAFVAVRFFALGTGNQPLYIVAGTAAAFFLGVARLLYNTPRESSRIR